MLGVDPALTARDWLGHGRFQRLLARAQHVGAHPRDHRRQPSAQVLDAARVGAVEVEPGLLYGVLRLGELAGHPVGHRLQVGTLGLEVYSAGRTIGRRRLGPTPPCSEHHGCADSKIRVIEQHEYLIDLLVGDEPGVDGLLPNLLEVGTKQACAGRPALPYS